MQPDAVATQAVAQRTFRSSDGLILAADVGGPADAPLVVLMHGGGQTRHSWSGAMTALVARGYRVVNFDLRGHGESGWSEAGRYSLDDRIDDLAAIVGQETQPFAFVGASLGGSTALCAAARGLGPVAVVVVDIVPHPETAGIDRIITFMSGHPDGFASPEEAVAAVAAYNPERKSITNPSGLMRNLRQGADGRLHWHWDPRMLAEKPGGINLQVQDAVRSLAQREPLPVLLVRGLSSDVVSDVGVQQFRDALPGLEVADVAGAGHMVAGDRNDAFNAAVAAFLNVHMPARSTPAAST